MSTVVQITPIEFRCTRPESYIGNCVGRTDLSARQGHYIDAVDMQEAAEEMAVRWPHDNAFDVQVAGESAATRFTRTTRGIVII